MTMKTLSATASLLGEIRACTTCAAHLKYGVRPVVQFSATARLVIIGQAPGSRVHASGVPWDDASGDRLREWTGLSKDMFYDPALVALVPMGFCYPGKGSSGDLPPRPECAPKWHDRVMAVLPADRFTVLVGSYAQRHYLPAAKRHGLARVVREYDSYGPRYFPIPHPSWRSGIWMRNNPFFEAEVVPALRERVREILGLRN